MDKAKRDTRDLNQAHSRLSWDWGSPPVSTDDRMQPYTVYLILQAAGALLFSLIFTVDMVYQVTVVGLTPLQLVLMGTILEVTIFLFELPTGIIADLRGRRLSIILGYVIMGAGFVVEGSLPFLWSVALAQVLWGLGYAFTSGATEA